MTFNDCFDEYDLFELEGTRDLVFSDRYALKDPHRDFRVCDKVVVLIDTIGDWEQRGVGWITEISDDGKTAKIELADTGEIIEKPLSALDRVLEEFPSDMWDRMAYYLPLKTEKSGEVEHWQNEFRWALEGFRFSPGGRINAYVGSEALREYVSMPPDFERLDLTAYNCFYCNIHTDRDRHVHGMDSRQAILDTGKRLVEIQARGGGIGINLSPLRPTRAHVKGVNGRSSGSVTWGNLYSFLTNNTQQGGSRRGALMLILNDWHCDIVEFIFSKNKPSDFPAIKEKWQNKFPHAILEPRGISYANISVGISDRFMEAVKNDGDWQLMFPDYESIDSETYNREWDGDIWNWIDKGYPVKVYATIRARDLWDCIMESAWASAEPGVVFLERCNKESNSWYFNRLWGTNPYKSHAA